MLLPDLPSPAPGFRLRVTPRGRGIRHLTGPGAASPGVAVLAPALRGLPDADHLASLRSLSDGDEDFASRLWQRHRSEARLLLAALVRAVADADALRARASLHTLHEGLSFFGATRLDSLGTLLAQHLTDHGTPGCLPLLVAYLREADRLTDTLDGLGN